MNRQIKFRAWDKDIKQMTGNRVCVLQFDKIWQNPRFELMQFTGLHDKNGKEIYEGDIVKDVSDSDEVFAVEWNDQWCGYMMPESFDEEASYPISHVQLEIIGNIYENPELLTPTK